jgi:TonB family protein
MPTSQPTRSTPLNDWDRPGLSAGELFRARYQTFVARATTIAVVAHVAAFAISPSWESSSELIPPLEPGLGGLLLLGPFAQQAADPAGAPSAAVSLLGEPDGTGATAGALEGEGPMVMDAEPGALWDAVGDRLRRGRPLVPALAVPTTAREAQAPGLGEPVPAVPVEDDLREIETDVTTIELADLPASDSLDLGRLTGLRPELAFMTASAWVLIRNQEEVVAYLRRTYREGRLDPAVAGTVSVTLWIDQSGSVEWAEVSQSSGRVELDEVALALFNEVADFRAARERGATVSRSVTFSLNFPW